MRLRPVDVHEQTFRTTFRGFDPVEVDGFLNRIADEMERLLEERAELEAELEEERMARIEVEDTLKTAKTLHTSMVEQAKEESRVALNQARLLADRIVFEAREESALLRREVHELKQKKASYLAELSGLAHSLFQWVDQMEQRDEEREARLAALADDLDGDLTPPLDGQPAPAPLDEEEEASEPTARSTFRLVAQGEDRYADDPEGAFVEEPDDAPAAGPGDPYADLSPSMEENHNGADADAGEEVASVPAQDEDYLDEVEVVEMDEDEDDMGSPDR